MKDDVHEAPSLGAQLRSGDVHYSISSGVAAELACAEVQVLAGPPRRAVHSRREALTLLEQSMVLHASLTFELRRDRRQDARPGPQKCTPYLWPGPGGLPLGLASNERLGVAATGAAMNSSGETSACGEAGEVRSSTRCAWDQQPWIRGGPRHDFRSGGPFRSQVLKCLQCTLRPRSSAI